MLACRHLVVVASLTRRVLFHQGGPRDSDNLEACVGI